MARGATTVVVSDHNVNGRRTNRLARGEAGNTSAEVVAALREGIGKDYPIHRRAGPSGGLSCHPEENDPMPST